MTSVTPIPRELLVQQSLGRFDAYLSSKLGRNGWNGMGAPLPIVMDEADEKWAGNARFVNSSVVVGKPSPDGTDVAKEPVALIHEFVHGITRSDLPLLGRGPYANAISEAVSDVLAVAISDGDTRIGPYRDIARPEYATVGAWEAAMAVRGRGVPLATHSLGAVLANSAVVASKHIGWDAVAKAWYGAVHEGFGPRLQRWTDMPVPPSVGPDSGPSYRAAREAKVLIRSFARATIVAARKQDPSAALAIADAWSAVGVQHGLWLGSARPVAKSS